MSEPTPSAVEAQELGPREAALLQLMEELNTAIQSGDTEKATQLQAKFFSQMSEQVQTNPFLELYGRAETKEWEGKWAEAEDIYREAIKLAVEAGDGPHASRSYSNLSGLLALLDREQEAFEAARLSVEHAPESNVFVRATSLPSLIQHSIRAKDFTLAQTCLDELRGYSTGTNDLRWAKYLLQLADWKMATDNLEGVVEDLETVRSIAEPLSKTAGMAGFASAMAHYWSIRAELFQREGNIKDAGAAVWETIQLRRAVSQAPQLSGPYKFQALAEALRKYARLCRSAGHETAANEAKVDSDEIRRLIHLPPLED